MHLTMVTTYGITYGKHSEIVQKQVTMDDSNNGKVCPIVNILKKIKIGEGKYIKEYIVYLCTTN